MRKNYVTWIFLLLTCLLQAQSIKTDYGVYPEPSPPSLPAAGGTFIDPVFGTTLLRVTDSLDGADNHQSYSYWPSFNKNSSLLYVSSVGGNPTLYDFDTVNFSISNKRPLFAYNPPGDGTPNAEDAIWSGIHPAIMLCHTSQKLYSYNVSTGQYILIHDFSQVYPNLFLQQMSRSVNDSMFGFTYKENINYTNVGWIAYRASSNNTDTANLSTLDEVQVDKTGDYLVIKTGNSGPGVIEVQILDLHTHHVENLTDNGPDFAPGHSDNGTGFVIGEDNWNNAYTFRTLANPHQFYNVIDYGNDWSQGTHVSMLADDESWLLISSFVASTLQSSGVFVDEIYQVATDGSQSVRRLAHTHSDYLHQNSNNAYWSMPKANISRNGKYAVFTSNWGSTTRRDVFVLNIPLPQATGIATRTMQNFIMYPNPSKDQVTIKLPSEAKGNLIISDVYGNKVAELSCKGDEELHWDVSALSGGIYLVRLGEYTQKLIIAQ